MSMYENKYVVLTFDEKTKDKASDIPLPIVLIFNSALTHKDIANRVISAMCMADDGNWVLPTSAGFCGKEANDKWTVWGMSETLKKNSIKTDSTLLNDEREFIEFGEKYSVKIKGLPPGAIEHITRHKYFSDARLRVR